MNTANRIKRVILIAQECWYGVNAQLRYVHKQQSLPQVEGFFAGAAPTLQTPFSLTYMHRNSTIMSTRLHPAQLLIACAISISCAAQPVFTSTDFAPNTGDQYTVGRGSVIVPTNTGPNQTWNFSSANISSNATYTVNPVSAIPCGSQYPLCNMGIGNGAYDMVQVTATAYNSVGNTSTPAMAQYVNSDPEKLFEFPMTYSYSFSDTYSSVNNQGPYPVYQEG